MLGKNQEWNANLMKWLVQMWKQMIDFVAWDIYAGSLNFGHQTSEILKQPFDGSSGRHNLILRWGVDILLEGMTSYGWLRWQVIGYSDPKVPFHSYFLN